VKNKKTKFILKDSAKEKIMGNVKNFKKWILPALMFLFFEFIFRQRISKKIFYDDLLVFNFFDNTVVNKYFK